CTIRCSFQFHILSCTRSKVKTCEIFCFCIRNSVKTNYFEILHCVVDLATCRNGGNQSLRQRPHVHSVFVALERDDTRSTAQIPDTRSPVPRSRHEISASHAANVVRDEATRWRYSHTYDDHRGSHPSSVKESEIT